ncbi:hypothetical protein FRC17_002302 [Serendipita sp. 399]|nr:hypothetical protein FRC17_002302 [Serendipita sp. 399]
MVVPPPTMRRNSKDIIASNVPSARPVEIPVKEEHGTTLGTIIRFSIENYYEIFDEVRDITEAIPGGEFQRMEQELGLSSTAARPNLPSPSTSPKQVTPLVQSPVTANQSKKGRDGASSPPPAALAPHQISAQRPHGRIRGPPPSAATQSMALLAKVLAQDTSDSNASLHSGGATSHNHLNARDGTIDVTSKAYQESRDYSGGQRSQSIALLSNGPSGSGWTGGRGTGLPRARSIISIEKTGDNKSRIFSDKGSINLGRQTITSGGTVRKAASAGVVGVGVTATGFFTAPDAKQ